jgi:hypothetical protein
MGSCQSTEATNGRIETQNGDARSTPTPKTNGKGIEVFDNFRILKTAFAVLEYGIYPGSRFPFSL